jgi:hypothetical protein
MSINPLASGTTSAVASTRSASGNALTTYERNEKRLGVVGATFVGIADAAADGVSATVSFSGKALHALAQAGEAAVESVEDGASGAGKAAGALLHGAEYLAVGAWHAVKNAAVDVEKVAEEGWDDLSAGIAGVGKLGESALESVGNGVSSAASAAVFVAAAGEKTLRTFL